MKHVLKPYAYLRYGDDWLCFAASRAELVSIQARAKDFLYQELGLSIHKHINVIAPVSKGINYLGIDLWTNGRRIDKEAKRKMNKNLSVRNVASYKSLASKHQSAKHVTRFEWKISDIISEKNCK